MVTADSSPPRPAFLFSKIPEPQNTPPNPKPYSARPKPMKASRQLGDELQGRAQQKKSLCSLTCFIHMETGVDTGCPSCCYASRRQGVHLRLGLLTYETEANAVRSEGFVFLTTSCYPAFFGRAGPQDTRLLCPRGQQTWYTWFHGDCPQMAILWVQAISRVPF